MKILNLVLFLCCMCLIGCSSLVTRTPASEICENEFKKNPSEASEKLLTECLQTGMRTRKSFGFIASVGQASRSEFASINNYVDHWGYLINKALRTSDMAYIAKNRAKLNRLDADLSEFPVYRGIAFRGSAFPPTESLETGKVFTDKAFISTSLDIEIAEHYAGSTGYLSVILSQSGRLLSYGKSTQELSSEKEILFPRNRMFKIQNVLKSERQGTTTVFLIEQSI